MTSGGAWRAEAVGHRRTEGEPPYERGPRPGEPLARRGGFAVHGAVGSVRATDGGRTLWTRSFAGHPHAAHLSGGRVLVTTDSLEYTPWGRLGPALLLDLADGRLVATLRGATGAALGGGRTLLVLDGGAIHAVGRGLDRTVLAELRPHEDARAIRTLRRDGDRLVAVIAEPRAAGTARWTVDTWTFRLTSRGAGS